MGVAAWSPITTPRLLDLKRRGLYRSAARNVGTHAKPASLSASVDVDIAAGSRLTVGLSVDGPPVDDRNVAEESYLGGALGEALLQLYVRRGWIQRQRRSRVVSVTPKGYESFKRLFI